MTLLCTVLLKEKFTLLERSLNIKGTTNMVWEAVQSGAVVDGEGVENMVSNDDYAQKDAAEGDIETARTTSEENFDGDKPNMV